MDEQRSMGDFDSEAHEIMGDQSWFIESRGPVREGIQTRQVLASRLEDIRTTSGVMRIMCKELPLDYLGLGHLKRIRKDELG